MCQQPAAGTDGCDVIFEMRVRKVEAKAKAVKKPGEEDLERMQKNIFMEHEKGLTGKADLQMMELASGMVRNSSGGADAFQGAGMDIGDVTALVPASDAEEDEAEGQAVEHSDGEQNSPEPKANPASAKKKTTAAEAEDFCEWDKLINNGKKNHQSACSKLQESVVQALADGRLKLDSFALLPSEVRAKLDAEHQMFKNRYNLLNAVHEKESKSLSTAISEIKANLSTRAPPTRSYTQLMSITALEGKSKEFDPLRKEAQIKAKAQELADMLKPVRELVTVYKSALGNLSKATTKAIAEVTAAASGKVVSAPAKAKARAGKHQTGRPSAPPPPGTDLFEFAPVYGKAIPGDALTPMNMLLPYCIKVDTQTTSEPWLSLSGLQCEVAVS